MSHIGLDLNHEGRHRPRRLRGCLAVLLALLLIGGGGYVAFTRGYDALKDKLSPPPDYPGPGRGSVTVEVHQGDTSTDIARTLKQQHVVKSQEAFNDAASKDPLSRGIQVGFYQLKSRMKASDALHVLVDHDNLIEASITIPEGLRVEDTVALLAKKTDYGKRAFTKVLHRHTDRLGLPSYAKGSPEGYLFPATYAFPPDATPTSMLRAMVDRWKQAAREAKLDEAAQQLGYRPGELMTVASLVESEANRDQDRGKVARVIYNRLETKATGHLLQIDATVNYALGRDLGLGLTQKDLHVDSPYNTRRYPGLPPGPIESPGDKAIEAAAHPTPGNWVYYVTVNLDTGETKFTQSYKTFLSYKHQLQQYCDGSDRC